MGMFRGTGGGGITGVLNSITFEVTNWPAKGSKKAYSTLSAVIAITPDGGTQPVKRFSRAGFFYPENQSVSKDGKTLSNGKNGGPVIAAGTDFAKLIGTLINPTGGGTGFPEDRLDKDGLDFIAVEGTRLTIANQRDEAATAEFGKRTGKNGQEYDRDFPVVTAVLSLPAEKAASKKAAKAEAAADVTELADETIVALIKAAKGNKIAAGKLKSTLVAYQMDHATMTKAQREQVFEKLTDTDYIKSAVKREVFDYDSDDDVYSAA